MKAPASFDSMVEQRMHELRVLASKYAKAQAERIYLEQFRQSKKAQLMKQAESLGTTAVGAQERDAYAHPDYVELLEGLRVATEEAERLRWELEISRMRIDLWRTQQATERAERRGYGA